MLIGVVADIINTSSYGNDTNISSFHRVCVDLDRVQRGDLFVAFKNSDIKQAIQNGAYGVVPSKLFAQNR